MCRWRSGAGKAERAMAKLAKKGQPVAPVVIEGRAIATTFWGKAWCDNLEAYSDFANRLPRGRTYVRNGSVVDLQIARGEVTALVSGSELYGSASSIDAGADGQMAVDLRRLRGRHRFAGRVAARRLSKGVMERICRQGGGLFPAPARDPLLVQLPGLRAHVQARGGGAVRHRRAARPAAGTAVPAARGGREGTAVGTDDALPMTKSGPAADKVLQADDVSALFGLDMAVPEPPPAAATEAEAREAEQAGAQEGQSEEAHQASRDEEGWLAERRLAAFQAFRGPQISLEL